MAALTGHIFYVDSASMKRKEQRFGLFAKVCGNIESIPPKRTVHFDLFYEEAFFAVSA